METLHVVNSESGTDPHIVFSEVLEIPDSVAGEESFEAKSGRSFVIEKEKSLF